MVNKRRRVSTSNTDSAAAKSKRPKFLLDHGKLPQTDRPGLVFVTGAGDFGQLGLGPDALEKTRFANVKLTEEIVDVCAGGMHTVCLTKDGKVLTFGCNDEGVLGRVAEEDDEFTAGQVELPAKAVQISAGDSHTAALLDDGRVFAWGTFKDSHGNMGLSLKGNERAPFEILPEIQVVKIASGVNHIVFLTNCGEIYTCGCAEQGQLGRTTERGSGRNARSTTTIGNNGQIAKLLQPALISLKPSLRLHFDDIWAGEYATFAKVADKDHIYVFGLNNYNQLGLKSTVPQYLPKLSKDFSKYKWAKIASGQHHSIALDVDGKTYAIGRKDYGRLGLGKDSNDAAELVEIPGLIGKKVVNIGCGSTSSFATTDEGELYGWGMGTSGQLGTGKEDDCFEPTLIQVKVGKADNGKVPECLKVFKVSGGGQHTVALASKT